MNSKVLFADEKLKRAFNRLKELKTEEKELYKNLVRSFEDLEKNPFVGIQIPKKLIPTSYKNKYGKVNNLWKYNLPGAWRVLYTVKREEVLILTIILEWFNHKDYKRKFNY